MDRNAILAAALSLAVIIAWQFFVIRPAQEKAARQEKIQQQQAKKKKAGVPAAARPLAAPAAPTGAAPSEKAPAGKKEAAPPPLPGLPALSGAAAAKPPSAPERRVRVDTGAAVFELTSRGAGLMAIRLNRYRLDGGKPIDLALGSRPALRPLFFWGGKTAARLNAAAYRVEGGDLALTSRHPEGTVRFVYAGADGLRAEKALTFRYDSYAAALRVRLVQPGGGAPIGLALGPGVGGSEGQTYGGVIEGPMSLVGEKIAYDKPEPGKPVVHGPEARWTALQSKHFITALIPREGAAGSEVRLLKKGDKRAGEYAAIVPFANPARADARFDLYAGPKEVERMARLGVGLEGSLDYGRFGFISRPLMIVLRAMHTVSGNWGVAIILLTVLVKLLFYPLTHLSMRNMKEMQRLQPKMNQIREIYKDDRTKMNEEVMNLYREHKVNPMMGCLPMIIQIPVFFGLYEALLVSIELRNAPFFWWITDLSKQDPYHVYTILMGASMFLQQRMTPTTGDPTQAKMMMFMPIVFTGMFIFYPVPVGLVIYWLVNNLLSIAQQYFVNRSVRPPRLAEGGEA